MLAFLRGVPLGEGGPAPEPRAHFVRRWERLAAPVEGTLFFAGEALAADYGTVHGALESGLRAARPARDGAVTSRSRAAVTKPFLPHHNSATRARCNPRPARSLRGGVSCKWRVVGSERSLGGGT